MPTRPGFVRAAPALPGTHERYSIGIELSLVGRFRHEFSYPVMGEQESPYFLFGHFWLSGLENRGRSALVGFYLVEYQLGVPG